MTEQRWLDVLNPPCHSHFLTDSKTQNKIIRHTMTITHITHVSINNSSSKVLIVLLWGSLGGLLK